MSPHRRWWTASLQCKPARRECPNNPVSYAARLVEGIGAGSPVGEEQAEADSLKDTGYGTDGDGVSGPLLGENLGDNRWGGRSEEDQGAEVGSTLVGESTGSVDEGADTVGLDGRTDNGATPRGSSGGGLLRVEELLLGVGLLRPAVGVSEDGAQDCERDGVVEGCAESNCRGLDGGEVVERRHCDEWMICGDKGEEVW